MRVSLWMGRVLTATLFIGVISYIAITVGFAAYLLKVAYLSKLGDFEKAAIGAMIAVIGTGLTALAALYTANRQATVAREVELIRQQTGADLATLSSKLSADLEMVKAQSSQALERLKVALDAEKVAHRELCGAAAIYFHALRSTALGRWDDEPLKRAELGMIEATRHLIYVSEDMRDEWLAFWQEAQHIYRHALAEPDEEKRPRLLKAAIEEKVQDGRSQLNLRDRHLRVEEAAMRAIEKGVREASPPS